MARIAHTVLDSTERYASRIRNGPHELTADEPEALGGGGSGPAPYQLLMSALGACTAATLRMYAERKGWELGTIHIEMELHKPTDDSTGSVVRVVSFSVPLSDEQRTKLAAIAEKTPVTRTLKAGTPITTELR